LKLADTALSKMSERVAANRRCQTSARDWPSYCTWPKFITQQSV